MALRIDELLKKYNPSSINSKNNVTNIITTQFKSNMKKVYEDHQLILINANRKLNFYSSFKKEIRKTEFLNLINSPQHKIAINKFRLSNHKLHIETGRHTTPNRPQYIKEAAFFRHANEIERVFFAVFFMISFNYNLTTKSLQGILALIILIITLKRK